MKIEFYLYNLKVVVTPEYNNKIQTYNPHIRIIALSIFSCILILNIKSI